VNPEEKKFHAQKFHSWLSSILPDKPPKGVVAYYFSIVELRDERNPRSYGIAEYGIGVMGASTYDPTNLDWADEGIWKPLGVGWFRIPSKLYEAKWEDAETGIIELVSSFVANPESRGARVLRSARCVAVGSVDGNTFQVWPDAKLVWPNNGDPPYERAV
jgi:hypothetical protein